jgi:hypothetical protein
MPTVFFSTSSLVVPPYGSRNEVVACPVSERMIRSV